MMFEFLGALMIFGLMLAAVIVGFLKSEKAVNRSITAKHARDTTSGGTSATISGHPGQGVSGSRPVAS